MYADFANVLVFILFGVLFVVVGVAVLSRLLRPRNPAEGSKEETYECGEPTVGSSWVRFDMRFYSVALLYLVFDVEVAFLYPWAMVFKELSTLGLFVFIEMAVFVGILIVGFIYVWAKGDLTWVKSFESQDR